MATRIALQGDGAFQRGQYAEAVAAYTQVIDMAETTEQNQTAAEPDVCRHGRRRGSRLLLGRRGWEHQVREEFRGREVVLPERRLLGGGWPVHVHHRVCRTAVRHRMPVIATEEHVLQSRGLLHAGHESGQLHLRDGVWRGGRIEPNELQRLRDEHAGG